MDTSMRPRPITFPEDMLPHDAVIEWWYFNGYLRGPRGRRFSFMDCLFRADVRRANIPYLRNVFGAGGGPYALFAHSVLADIGAQKAFKDIQNVSMGSRDTFSRPRLYANYIDPLSFAGGFVVHEMEETVPGTFHLKTETLDLTLISRKKPMLQGGKGFIAVRGRESFYYSLTDLAATGMVKDGDGAWVPVEGRAWMDHQWADTPYANDRWTWFSMQLEGGTDIMCVEYDDGTGKDHIADMLGPRGASRHAVHAEFLPGERRSKSKETKAEYPLEWTIRIPEWDAQLHASAMMDDGEMVFGAINYWEGPVRISGRVQGRSVKGVGFMELAGYPYDYNYLVLAGKNMNARIARELAARFKGRKG